MVSVTESTVEVATLDWLAELGYAIVHGAAAARGELATDGTTGRVG